MAKSYLWCLVVLNLVAVLIPWPLLAIVHSHDSRRIPNFERRLEERISTVSTASDVRSLTDSLTKITSGADKALRDLIKAFDASVRFIAVLGILNLMIIGLGVYDCRRGHGAPDVSPQKV